MIGSWWVAHLLHKYLTSILPGAVNNTKSNLVDNQYHQRDIKSVNTEIWP
jgi:hypothetical protein